ncbi:hypothetical protein [Actinoplanes flavus]|uniref:Nucleotide exchange factor GrpE n=1 Tax=Actinoplanes flavus TaxID=2820290 RepID=A0ABS3UZZ1_9ACTN|nr:hypothetical protein [Actinoplanes flavus]MBO3744146.1 hypothetical protein [Actinoplanes flavus]
MSIENRPDDQHDDDHAERGDQPDEPVKREDARIGSAGGGQYPLADSEREKAEES